MAQPGSGDAMAAAVTRVVDLVSAVQLLADADGGHIGSSDVAAAWKLTYSESGWDAALLDRTVALAQEASPEAVALAAAVGSEIVAAYSVEVMAAAVLVAQLSQEIAERHGVTAYQVLRRLADAWTSDERGT